VAGTTTNARPILDDVQGDYQYGFRVPLIVVSAFTPRRYINNEQPHDFGTISPRRKPARSSRESSMFPSSEYSITESAIEAVRIQGKGPASALRGRAAGPGARMHAVGEHNRAEGPYRLRRDSQGGALGPVEKVARPPIRNPRRPPRAMRAALQEAFAPLTKS
jgi:hypothetical protein